MAPPKKRARIIVSDEEDEIERSTLLIRNGESKLSTRRSTRLRSKASEPVSKDPDSEEDHPAFSQTSVLSQPAQQRTPQKPKLSATKSQRSPSKSPVKSQQPNASIKTFFNNVSSSQIYQLSVSQKARTASTKGAPKRTASKSSSGLDRLISSQGVGHSNFEDHVEDISDDDEGLGSRTMTVVKSSGSSVQAGKEPEVESTLPWPEKYAPTSLETLAVNKTKVDQVRGWLEAVLDGRSHQRLLILKGPAGSGKTATIQCLSKELKYEILEWKNPSGASSGENGLEYSSFSGMFEEFLARAGKWNPLDLVSSAGTPIEQPDMYKGETSNDRKVILIEDFPNILTPSSAPLQAFQHSIKSFLALPAEANPSPLILIITESPNLTGNAAFTVQRLVGPAILHHPRTSEIEFRPIAKRFMVKALERVLQRECMENKRIWGPSKAVLEKVGDIGDIRSALAGLEFLCITGEETWRGEVKLNVKTKKKQNEQIAQRHEQLLKSITSRETHLNLFHAVGKVVYNKRYGDDTADPYHPPLPAPSHPHHPYHKRAHRSPPQSILEELVTDMSTYISALHENYLPSCTTPDHTNSCLDYLSDADLLLPVESYGEGLARQQEIAFEVSVRGLFMSLPSPVRRAASDSKLSYPLSCRLWRKKEENEGLLATIGEGLRQKEIIPKAAWPSASALNRDVIPYSLRILSARAGKERRTLDTLTATMKKYSTFGQLPREVDEYDEDEVKEEHEDEESNAKSKGKKVLMGPPPKPQSAPFALSKSEELQGGGELSDDEIQDFDD